MIFKIKDSLWYRTTHAQTFVQKCFHWAYKFGRNRNQRLIYPDPDIAKDCPEGLLQQFYPYYSFTREKGKEVKALRACLRHSNRRLTCEQLAMVLVGKPMDGAQATSRTQSL